ncbi:MAG: hypothetical protein ACOCSF_01140 [Halanaeroarchaeum sp.]
MSEKSSDPETRRPDEQAAETATTDESGVSRRKLMAAGAAGWATVGLAGCSTVQPDCEDEDGDNGNSGTDGGDDVTATTQTTTTDGDTPTTTEEGGDGGGGGGDGGTTTECAQSSVFAPGMDIGFLVDIYDDLSGDKLDDEALSSVTITFPFADLEPVELTPSGPHQDHVSDKWGGKVSMPIDAEPGTYKYEIEIARDPDDDPDSVITDEVKLVDISL